MAVIEFRSLVNPQHVFAVMPGILNDNSWNYSEKAISPYFVWADCINDYPTRHTPYGLVISERFEEFLHALALHLQDKPKHVQALAEKWPRIARDEVILRFHKIKYNESKKTYYNEYGETSVARSCQHDRRWTLVLEHANGGNTPAQCYSMMPHGYNNSLYRFLWFTKANNVIPGSWKIPKGFLPDVVEERQNYLANLVACLQSMVNAWREGEAARRSLENYTGMVEYDKTKG